MDLVEQKNAAFQERVRVRLAVLNINQSELAASVGVTRQRLSQILQVPYSCEISTVERLADALGVKVSWLLDGDLKDALPDPEALPETLG